MNRQAEREKLQSEIQTALYSSYWFAATGVAIAVAVSRFVPSRLKYAPLAVFGVTGSLLDFAAGQRRASPLQEKLRALEAEEKASNKE